MASYIGSTGVYAEEKLVVERPYMGRVREIVAEIGGADDVIDRGEESTALNLTRFELPGLASMRSRLSKRVDQDRSGPSQLLERIRPPDGQASDLDLLLFVLRTHFASRNTGWAPAMGKDRDVESITGLPHLSGGGRHYPECAPAERYHTAVGKDLGKGVRVGVLDTRLARDFPIPEQQLEIDSGSWLEPREAYPHWAGHGTFVTGLIAAQAPSTTIVYRGVLDDKHARATSWDVAHQIVAMRSKDIKILNLSLGLVTEDGQETLVLSQAIRQLGGAVIIVAAAGNHGEPAKNDERWPRLTTTAATYPAASPGVIAVGATDKTAIASFTPSVSWLRFYAEGASQVSTYLTGMVEIRRSDSRRPLLLDPNVKDGEAIQQEFFGFANWAGTSMATAVVSGRLAALTRNTGGDTADALRLLTEEARTGRDSVKSDSAEDNRSAGLNSIRLADDSRIADLSMQNRES